MEVEEPSDAPSAAVVDREEPNLSRAELAGASAQIKQEPLTSLNAVPLPVADASTGSAPAVQRPPPPEPSFVWPLRQVNFPPGSSESVSVVLQNENGPCSLIALANLLLVSRRIALRPNAPTVSYEELAERIANELLARRIDAASPDLMGALEVLPKTRFGLDVNVRFGSVDGFAEDGTGALALFRLSRVKLLHGWVADEADPETWEAVVTRSGDYDTAVSRLVEADELATNVAVSSDSANAAPIQPENWTVQQSQLVSDALLIRRFLDVTASQLTYPGLFSLATHALEPGELAALFRNAHFTVIYRRPSQSGEPRLFHLVTDSTLARAKTIVWEGLTDVDGAAAEFYDAHLTPSTFEGDFVSPPSPARARRAPTEDADLLLAQQLQEQERNAAEERRRRQEHERSAARPPPPPRPVPVPLADPNAKRKKKEKDKCVVS